MGWICRHVDRGSRRSVAQHGHAGSNLRGCDAETLRGEAMKIGMVTDSLGHLGLARMLETAAALGIKGLEFNAANWTSAPHMDLMELLPNVASRRNLLSAVQRCGLEII